MKVIRGKFVLILIVLAALYTSALGQKVANSDSGHNNLPDGAIMPNAPPVINDLTSDKVSPQYSGSVITWMANATDLDGDPVLHRYLLNDEPVSDWTSDNMWTWIATDAGSYRIEVQVRDGKHSGPNGVDDVRSDGFMLNKQPSTKESAAVAPVTLTLYIHSGSVSGPSIAGALIAGHDGNNNSFYETADSNGLVVIKGKPGSWSFTASAEGFESKNWSQQITEIFTTRAFLQKSRIEPDRSNPEQMNLSLPKISLTLHIHEGSVSGNIIPRAKVIVQGESGNGFHETADNNGIITINGNPGTWYITVSAEGYEPNSWSQTITDTCIKHVFLKKSQSSAYLKLNQPSDSKSIDSKSMWNSNLWNAKWAAKGSGKVGRPAYQP